MHKEELYGEFVRRLNEEESCRATVDQARSVVVITSWDDEILDPPVALHLGPDALEHHVARLQDDACAAFPELADPVVAALELFVVHVVETVFTRDDSVELRLIDGRLQAVGRTPDRPPEEARGDTLEVGRFKFKRSRDESQP